LLVLRRFASIFYDNYKVDKEVDDTKTDIKESVSKISSDDLEKLKKDLISKIPIKKPIKPTPSNPEDNPEGTVEDIPEDNPEETDVEPKINVNNDMVSLLAINDETVGWISIKNTNVDYPVVQHKDNDFYLTRDFYKKKAYSGWIFMDYRNNYYDFNDNTIIYGHNRYSNGTMFGTLSRTSEKDWYEDEDNLIITYDTLFGTTKWEIFSTYKILVTSDYLEIKFSNDDKRLEFYNMLKDRSTHDFGVELTADDKILTLSTCYKSNQRYVVHARLIKEAD
jgi:sortase B